MTTPHQIQAMDATFSDRLLATRTAMRVSRKDLAERSGVPYRTIEGIELGRTATAGCRASRRRPTVGEAVALAQALGVQVKDLLTGGVR